MTSAIWTPIKIGNVDIRNRVYLPAHWVLPMNSPAYAAYLKARARGGNGLIIGCGPAPHSSAASVYCPPGWMSDWVGPYREVVDAVHSEGSAIFVQIGHQGAPGYPITESMDSWAPLWSPSGIRAPNHLLLSKVMEASDIEELIEGFVSTAVRAQDTGAEGVEIHVAHGYLLSAFVSPYWNRRDDDYGGDTVRRARIVREIGEGVRARCGEDFVVGMKMNFDEYRGEQGLTPEEALRVVEAANVAGVYDYLSIAHTDYQNYHRLIPPASSGDSASMAVGAKYAK
jgi:2,4-dienoyl-CoA reductase-like NADH-dependent reductase (Old Yellow Enzyme family)